VSEIRGGTDFEQWLYRLDSGQEAALSPVLTMRITLRVLPGLCAISGGLDGEDNWRERVTLSIARASSALWLSCIDATNAPRLRNIAFVSSAQAASIVSGLQNRGLRDCGDSFAFAAAGAVYAVYAVNDATTGRPAGEIAYTACSALSAILGPAPAFERQAVFWAALDADIGLIEAGVDAQSLATAPVWGTIIDIKAVQPELSGLIGKLRAVFSARHRRWDAWVDWYEARLAGGPTGYCSLGKSS